jgi:uncharacterized membrane protein YfcA
MDPAQLAALLALAAVAAYVQTLTGFAFGLMMMGGVGLTGIIPLADAAVLVSILVVVNAAQVLAKGWRDIAGREFALMMVSSLVFLLIGYWLLGILLMGSLSWLKLALGAVIIVSSIQLLFKPEPLERRSGNGSFLFFGAIAGLMGGLFSTAGPPLVYHLYRQPLRAAAVRETLVAVFALNALLRLTTVALVGQMPDRHFFWSLTTIPVVIAFTYLARRYPPGISPLNMRRLAFVLLFLSGASLALPALLKLIGDFS